MKTDSIIRYAHKMFRRHVTWRGSFIIAYLSIMVVLILYMKISYNIYNDFYCIKMQKKYNPHDIAEKIFKLDNLGHQKYDDFLNDPYIIIKYYDFPYDPYFKKITKLDEFIDFIIFGNFITHGGRKRTVSVYYREKNGNYRTASYFVSPCLKLNHISGMELNANQVNEQTNNELLKRGLYD